MRILVIGETLKTRHKEQILDVARKYGAKVCFAGTESEVTEEFAEPDVIYGFGMQIAKTQKSLKWLCVPSAGVDYFMKPGVFANEDCILSNSSGAYGVSISEHMIAVSLTMMRRLTEFFEETRGILTRERLWSLPEGAFVVNVGRGSAIDEEALADCMEAGHLAGAALDVFQKEPLPKESRLWKTKGMLITPHVAGNLTLEYTLDKNVAMFCEDLVNFAEGKPLKYGVDRTKGY